MTANKHSIFLYSANQAREIDRVAIDDFGIETSTLMARAAEASLKTLLKKWPHTKKITIVCGIGNNAGDGFVLARIAESIQIKAKILLIENSDKFGPDALEAYQALNRSNIIVKNFKPEDLSDSDVIVDAIFGSGLNRQVSGAYQEAIIAINASAPPVLALDLPSGLCANTGTTLGTAVKANATVTFITKKQGLFTADGPDCCGEIYFDDLKIPEKIFEKIEHNAELIDIVNEKFKLTPRPKNSHKGLYGHTLVVGGNTGMSGAALIACRGALRTGSGLVSLITKSENAELISASTPEIMADSDLNEKSFVNKLEMATVIAIGPGLGQNEWAKNIYTKVMATKKPLIVDADAINLLAQSPQRRGNWILTPHPGEAARLLGKSRDEIQANRFENAKELSEKYDATIVLKGCGTIIYGNSKKFHVCPHGNPLMASGGMGDALTGIIAAMIAQGLDLENAATFGTALHAAAGDLAAQNIYRGLLASDLIEHLQRV